jgi:hypothetical protein
VLDGPPLLVEEGMPFDVRGRVRDVLLAGAGSGETFARSWLLLHRVLLVP